MPLKTLVFGAIGVLVETSDLQRQSFNAAFAANSLDWDWSYETYKKLLHVNGGKNRVRYFAEKTSTPLSETQIEAIHQSKTDIYESLIKDGGLRARNGIADLIQSAKQIGIKVGMASTTSIQNIDAIFAATKDLNKDDFDFILSGADVKTVKPEPEIYLEAINRAQSNPVDIVVIEDTPVSAQSARSAQLAVVIYPGTMTKNQDLDIGNAVISEKDLTLEKLGQWLG